MSVNHEIFEPRFEHPGTKLVPFNVSIGDGALLNLSSKQVDCLKQDIQADLGYTPGGIGTIQVPLNPESGCIPHPVQVSNVALRASDLQLKNRAIAKIGQVYAYWKSMSEVLHNGEIDFFNLISYRMLPLYINKDYQLLVKTEPITRWNMLFNKSPFTRYVSSINYAGDSDFVGVYEPTNHVPFYTAEHERKYMPHDELGIVPTIAREIYENDGLWRRTNDAEFTALVLRNESALSSEARTLVYMALSENDTISAFKIARTYYVRCISLSDEADFDRGINDIRHVVNAAFRKNYTTSPTVKAVDMYCDSLDRMYHVALPRYELWVD